MRIINSLLDIDSYKLTMQQVAHKHFPEVTTAFGFTNRTARVHLPDFIDEGELRAELGHIQTLRFAPDELEYLRESEFIPRGRFSEEYLAFLSTLRLPDLAIENQGSTFKIEVEGPWKDVTLWETLILSVVSELYNRSLLSKSGLSFMEVEAEGQRRLKEKIQLLKTDSRVRFSDFGTRRRYSGDWQRYVVETIYRELPVQFVGTSNVLLAKELGIAPIGTYAHEMDMVLSGIYHGNDQEIRGSHQKFLELWWEEYGDPLSVALTDTYGTDFFLRDFTPEQARKWRGMRHDSGDPFKFGERGIAYYKGLAINPRGKTLFFSDGLDVQTILGLTDRFVEQIGVSHGWGTNLTNDLGFDPASLVVKAIRSCGYGTVKLTDNLDKAIGEREDVERFMRIFDHTEIERTGVKY